jgi:hypothetical protein
MHAIHQNPDKTLTKKVENNQKKKKARTGQCSKARRETSEIKCKKV